MIVDGAVERYVASLHAHDDAVLAAMEAEAKTRDFPIIGPVVGAFVHLLAKATGAKEVFEMGSGYGYSTLWFAKAGARVVHTDGSQQLSDEAQKWLGRAGLAERVERRVGDALALLAADPQTYDIVFCDVDKDAYPDAWEIAKSHVAPGGLVIFDNMLWKGDVADRDVTDAWTEAVRETARRAFSDEEFDASIVPLRDGVLVARRSGRRPSGGAAPRVR